VLHRVEPALLHLPTPVLGLGSAVVARPWRCYLSRVNLEELADLVRANGANTNGRIDSLRNEVNATLMTIQNDFTDVRGDIKALRADVAEVRQSLDLATLSPTFAGRSRCWSPRSPT
jgi:hypothetical protein